MNILDRVRSRLAPKSTASIPDDLPEVPPFHPHYAATVPQVMQMGIVRRGYDWILTNPLARMRGVKLVTLPIDFVAEYNDALEKWNSIQVKLLEYPQSLRPRRKSVRRKPETPPAVSTTGERES